MSNIEQAPSLLQAAIHYASLEWRVFPLSPLSKIPRFKHWPWQEAASNRIADVKSWWTRWPDSNIGILADDRMTILDIDRHPGKADGFQTIGHLLDYTTVHARSPNAGMHFYHQPTNLKLRELPGVNVITGHRYAVAAPSVLQPECPWDSPLAYLWQLAPMAPWDLGLTPLSADLIELLKDVPRETFEATDFPGLLENLPSIPRAQLKECHRIFLQTGEVTEFPSRSEVVMSMASRLYQLGYEDIEVVSMLWNEDWVQVTAREHRRGDDTRALEDWLWGCCQKVRHHRGKKAEEAFTPVAGSRQEEIFRRLRDRALRVTPADEVKTLLQEVAVARLPAVDEDEILAVLKANSGRSKQALSRTLTEYKANVREQGRGGPRWRHTLGENDRPVSTVENLKVLLATKGASIWHNLMSHRIELHVPGYRFGEEERLNNQLTTVRSWAAEYGLAMDPVPEQLVMLATEQPYHPFQSFVESRPWDGLTRLPALMATVKTEPEDTSIKEVLLRRWLVSICAAVWGYGTRAPRGVLTFTGPQQTGKTTWLRYLVPGGMYHQGLLLRPDQRDSAVKGLRYLVVEIGEIGATFRASDIEALKAYIGQHEDCYRLPYARDESVWKRRTIFAASANEREILHDQSGNTRWWVVPVTGFDLNQMEKWWGAGGQGHQLQQLWAEVLTLYHRGEPWDLSDDELNRLESHQLLSRDITPIEQMLIDTYAWEEEMPPGGYPVPKREVDINREIGWGRPFSPIDGRQLRAVLRRMTGMRQAVNRRVSLATVDGQKTPEAQGKVVGRWWMLPRLRGQNG